MRSKCMSRALLPVLCLLSVAMVQAQTIEVKLPAKLTLARAKRIALLGNPGVEAMLARVKVAEAQAGQTKSTYLPTLSGSAGMYWPQPMNLVSPAMVTMLPDRR